MKDEEEGKKSIMCKRLLSHITGYIYLYLISQLNENFLYRLRVHLVRVSCRKRTIEGRISSAVVKSL